LIEKLKPDVVLSDGYYTGILAAQTKKIPVYNIGSTEVTNTPSFTGCPTIRFKGKNM
jgi:UDP:flavonoid glycosyltransferase YjiC (YdhE family)